MKAYYRLCKLIPALALVGMMCACSATGTGMAIGKDAKTTVNVTNINSPGYTLEQYNAALKEREKDLEEKYKNANAADKENRTLLEVELNAVRGKLGNIQQAFAEERKRREETEKTLDKYKDEFGAADAEKAKQALGRGDTGDAEKLFKAAMSKSD